MPNTVNMNEISKFINDILGKVKVEINKPEFLELMYEDIIKHGKFSELSTTAQEYIHRKKNKRKIIEPLWEEWFGGKRAWTQLFGEVKSKYMESIDSQN